MEWLYTPICIRIVSLQSDSLPHGLSGVNVVLKNGNEVVSEFCLTICHIPLHEISAGYDIYISALHLMNEDEVQWRDGAISASVPVFLAQNDPLFDYVKHALGHGFNFIPLHTLVGNSVLGSLNLLQLRSRPLYSERFRSVYRDFAVGASSELAEISVRSSPFNFTNPVLFSEFVSVGNVNVVVRDGNTCCGYLSDVKYLENMSGAVVNTSTKSLGLLLGNLRKLNGDGDLLVIGLWERLLVKLLPKLEGPEKSILHLSEPVQLNQTAKHLENFSVFPVVLSENGNHLSWGSCLLLNLHTLVTNYHVIKPFLTDETSCHILLQVERIVLSLEDQVVVPFEELDLAFIQLSLANQHKLGNAKPVKMSFSHNECVSDKVITAGFGLLLNDKHLTPVVSTGHISSKIYLSPFPDRREIPCMLVTSLSCWNGSSGGGLFNERGSLVGLICSNAQVFVPSVSGQGYTKSEKVPLFCLCIPLELILECYRIKVVENLDARLSEKVEKAWKLNSYHQDVLQREAKL